MAFPQDVLDVRTELKIGGVWTDISEDVYTRSPITITRGRPDEAARVQPTRLSLTLNNRDGKYSPRNPHGPHYGLIGRNTPVRVSVPGDESYLQLTGAQGDIASTPDTAALDITGDIDVAVEATGDWYSSASQTLIGKWSPTDGQRSWILRIFQGFLIFNWTTSGSDSTGGFAQFTLPALPRRAAMRATLDVDNGAGGYDVALWLAESLDGPWTQLAAATGGSTTSIFASTSPLEIGPSVPAVSRAPLRGRVHRAWVRSGIGGTAVADPDFRGQPEGTTSFADTAGRTWTVAGDAEISDRQYRAVAEVSEWPARWDVSGNDVWVPIEAAGIQRRLVQGKKALDSTLRRRVPSGGPIAYWPMEEGRDATQAYSPVPGVAPMVLHGFEFAADDSLTGSLPLPKMGQDGGRFATAVPQSATTGWHVEMAYRLPALPSTERPLVSVAVAGAGSGVASVVARVSTAGIRIACYDREDALVAGFTYTDAAAIAAFTSGWNRLQIFTAQDGSSTYLNLRWEDVSTGEWAHARTVYTGSPGRVTGVSGHLAADLTDFAFGHLAVFDVGGTVAAGGAIATTAPGTDIYDGADDGFAGESALDRLRRLADEEAATLDLTWTDGDTSRASTAMGPQRPGLLTGLLEEAADTDGGVLYERADRLALHYRDRSSLENQAVALALDYATEGEVAPPLEPSEDDQRLRNDVTVRRDGGSEGRVVLQEGPLSVLAPPAGVGPYEETVTLSLASDSQPELVAGWRVHLGTVDEARYPTVRLWLHAAPHLIPDVLALDVGDRLTIAHPPAWLPPDTIDQLVLGYTEVLDQYTWDVTLNCTPAAPWNVGLVGSPELGRVDTDGSELAADADADDTTLAVAVTDGPVWVLGAPALNPNPRAVDDLSGTWFGNNASIARVATPGVVPVTDGAWSIEITPNGSSASGGLNSETTAMGTVTPGSSYTVSCWAYSPGGWADLRACVDWLDAAGTYLTSGLGSASVVAAGEWTFLSQTFTAPVSASRAQARARHGGTPSTSAVWYVTQLTIRPALLGEQLAEFPIETRLGGEVVRVEAITGATSPQTHTVVRAVNGVTKDHSAGTDVRLAHPLILAL